MPDLESVMRGGGRMKDAGYGIEWGPGPPRPRQQQLQLLRRPGRLRHRVHGRRRADRRQLSGAWPEDWKWPTGRVDHWGISAPPSARLKEAQRQIHFATGLKA
jgi:catechol 2,3-dioxygenase